MGQNTKYQLKIHFLMAFNLFYNAKGCKYVHSVPICKNKEENMYLPFPMALLIVISRDIDHFLII